MKLCFKISYSCRKYELDPLEGIIAEHASGMPPRKISSFHNYTILSIDGICYALSLSYPFGLTLGILFQGSRKITYKGLIKDSISIVCNAFQSTVCPEENSYCDKSQGEVLHEVDRDMALALPEIEKSTCASLKRFFTTVSSFGVCFMRYTIDDIFLNNFVC